MQSADSPRHDQRLDPVTLQIFWSRLLAVADEAATTLHRTSFSPVVRESNDFAFVLLDTAGNSLAQSSVSVPSMLAAIPRITRTLLKRFPLESLHEGDVLISNDPWIGTGQLDDITVVAPVFLDGRALAFTASTAHSPSIGGRRLSLHSRDVYEEGIRIPVSKLFEKGEPNDLLLEFLRLNTRGPDEVIGDLMAQVAANRMAGRRLVEFAREAHFASLDEISRAIRTQSEESLRDAIAKLPAGTYRSHVVVENVGENGQDVEVRLALTVDAEHGELICDFAGSSPQQRSACNVCPNYAYGYSVFALKSILAPNIPNNEGCFRPITVAAPEGSVLNPRFPAAVGGRHFIGHALPAAIFEALAPIATDRVFAASGAPVWFVLIVGERKDGTPFACTVVHNGGMGAGEGQDGFSCLTFPSAVANAPIEILENVAPIRYVRRELLRGSGGAGRWRGGDGQLVEIEILAPHARIIPATSRTKYPAPGLRGGLPGAMGELSVDGVPIQSVGEFDVTAGSLIRLVLPGGGGFGEPEPA